MIVPEFRFVRRFDDGNHFAHWRHEEVPFKQTAHFA